MASSIFYKASVERDLRKLDRPVESRLLSKLEHTLSADPDAGEPLSGEFQGLFKLRVGDYRVIYAKAAEGVLVVRIRHSKNAYR